MPAPEILISHELPPAGPPSDGAGLAAAVTERLPDAELTVARNRVEALKAVPSAEILLAIRTSDELLDAAANLRWVQSLYAGVGGFDADRLAQLDVALTSGAGIHAGPVAETVLGYLLIFERGFLRGLDQQRSAAWKRYPVGELAGGTLGIVGLGAVGRRIAELGSAFGMTVVGSKRDPDVDIEAVDEVFGPDGLYEVASRADYLVLACPLTDETRGLIDREALVAMKTSGVLVNVARGPVVDEAALVDALGRGLIEGAAIDVAEPEPLEPDSPLWDMPDVIVTPHVAGGTDQYWERGAELFAENYAAFVEGRLDELTNRVV